MATMIPDLTPMRQREITSVRITGLRRLRVNEWPEQDISRVHAVSGQTLRAVTAVRHRFPIHGLRVEIDCKSLGIAGVAAFPVGRVNFPEQATLFPDPILESPAVDVPSNTTQSFLFRLVVPSDATAGEHQAAVRIFSDSHQGIEQPVVVHVSTLPPGDAMPDLGECVFWPHWNYFRRYYGIPLWSERFWTLAERFLAEMAAGGMNVVMASVVEDPFHYPLPEPLAEWHSRPGMIQWIKKRDGSFTFDYSVYDRYVELNFKYGIDRRIECHSLLPCKRQRPWIRYWDEATARPEAYETDWTTPGYREPWQTFLKSFAEHNARKGWLDKLSLSPYDEPQDPESFVGVAEMAREIIPSIRIMAAVSVAKSLAIGSALDIGVLHLCRETSGYDPVGHAELRKRGVELHWYNCLNPTWGNTLFESSLGDAYRMPWITVANGFKGYLRHSIVGWTEDPWRDPAFNWPAGDLLLLYPGKEGPASSLRWEAYKAGREDLQILLSRIASTHGAGRTALRQHLRRLGRIGTIQTPSDLNEWTKKVSLTQTPFRR